MKQMKFKSKAHQDLFNVLVEKAGQGGDPEYSAAIYVLSAIGKEVSKYVLSGEIKFPALFKAAEVWSSGEKALLRLAATLFNAGTWPVAVDDVFYHLDGENQLVAVRGLAIRYMGLL